MRWEQQLSSLKLKQKTDIEVLEDKIKKALNKKDESIIQREDELRVSELKIQKLTRMLDEQRSTLLK